MSYRHILGLAAALGTLATITPPVSAGHSVANEPEPRLEIFSNQQPILIGRGQFRNVFVLGAVYDGDIEFGGRVSLRPNGPQASACPIFSFGENTGVQANRNTTDIPFGLQVAVPGNHPLGTFTCALTYSASQVNPATGVLVPIATLGNEVRFQYTVRNRFVF
ncbi:hypothetical protein [Noviherbaspirillum aridicola]|uniref:Secreted protein n=1 Tax=Noviherbaspirillum aridicola TaxID=2849687 RepID=A0ABQ4Q3Q2_9BURK|nr:hypothetical protein [Noviherbaspirillum aridicola]GIZ51822.1 hypothetical protein NCCP691_18360 [Noviherbaspirillum aridicola]